MEEMWLRRCLRNLTRLFARAFPSRMQSTTQGVYGPSARQLHQQHLSFLHAKQSVEKPAQFEK